MDDEEVESSGVSDESVKWRAILGFELGCRLEEEEEDVIVGCGKVGWTGDKCKR